jgi:tRNA G18 (ribose-2'-O)-methylase SpoU
MRALRGTPLKRFHRDFRRQHPIQHDIAVILENVEYPVNVGSIFRIADAARVEELILTGVTPTPPNPTVVKVGRNKHRSVPWRYEKEASKAIAELKDQGYRIFALEITEGAHPYYETDWPAKTCLVVGHEDQSITRATLALCDDVVFIPMWGKGLSLNVHVALAVVVFHIRALGLAGNHLID